MQTTYNNGLSDQPIVKGSSQPFEVCPHVATQCDAKATILANTYKHTAQKQLDIESADYNSNQPYHINLTDSADWQKLHIASAGGTVCSYKF